MTQLVVLHKTLLAAFIVGAGLYTAIDFNHTITLGSILIAFLIVIAAGVFTIRSKIASIWREEAEGERARRQRTEEENRDLKDQLLARAADLKAMEAKTDLTTALDSIRRMNEAAVIAITSVVSDSFIEKSKLEHAETHRLLKEISDKLPSEPIEIELRTPTIPPE